MVKQMRIAGKVSCHILSLAVLFGATGHVFSEPLVSQVSLLESDRIERGAKVRISGTGFGAKSDAAPVLVDYVDQAFEYGKRVEPNSGLGDMSRIPMGVTGDPSAIWATSTGTFLYSTQDQTRHENSSAVYFLDGENAWLGRPIAYGGTSGWETPTDNPQLYVSWWYKNRYHSTYYWRFSPDSQKGEFEIGEGLVIEGLTGDKSKGVYVGVDADGLHNAVLYRHRNANELKGLTIKGVSSGAVTIFPDKSRGSSGYGFEIPGSKVARIWDDPDGADGIRSSVALHNAYVDSASMYYYLGLEPNKWVHIEYEIDTDKGLLRVSENGKILGEDYFSPDAIYKGKYSPTLALLGTNAKQLKLQKSWISEIYVDKSLQRVAIGNADNYGEVTHHEIQRPIKWSNTDVEIAVNLGSLDFNEDLYVYVFNSDGVVNNKGFPLCTGDACPIPPSSIQLLVD